MTFIDRTCVKTLDFISILVAYSILILLGIFLLESFMPILIATLMFFWLLIILRQSALAFSKNTIGSVMLPLLHLIFYLGISGLFYATVPSPNLNLLQDYPWLIALPKHDNIVILAVIGLILAVLLVMGTDSLISFKRQTKEVGAG